jgi:UDP-N-acetylglucosamine transferase subunit ALG13
VIFVTVGTHEQSFNRLVEEIDRLKGDGKIEDEVVIQKGYSTYCPKYCRCYEMLPYEEMERYQKEARIIITHGGPASFIYPISIGKTPIVVPRQYKYGEHVNNHQLEFCKDIVERDFPIIIVENIEELEEKIVLHEKSSEKRNLFSSNTEIFQNAMIEKIKELF